MARERQEVRQPLLTGAMGAGAAVTKVLIGINAALFVLEMIAGQSRTISEFGMWPVAIALDGQWYRLLTAAFLHGGLLHIAFNMYVLWVIGPPLEAMFGRVRFIVIYLGAALGGSVASYVFSPVNTVSVGASGAIFGLMAALIVAGHSLRRDVTQVAVLLGINVVIGLVVPGIDWRAHLGGAAVGAILAAGMAHAPRQSRVLWQTLVVLGVSGALVLAVSARTMSLEQRLVPTPAAAQADPAVSPQGPGRGPGLL